MFVAWKRAQVRVDKKLLNVVSMMQVNRGPVGKNGEIHWPRRANGEEAARGLDMRTSACVVWRGGLCIYEVFWGLAGICTCAWWNVTMNEERRIVVVLLFVLLCFYCLCN
jgi:hypothetical protein